MVCNVPLPGCSSRASARDQHLLPHEVRAGAAGGGVGDEVVDGRGRHAADFVAEGAGDVRRDDDVRQRPERRILRRRLRPRHVEQGGEVGARRHDVDERRLVDLASATGVDEGRAFAHRLEMRAPDAGDVVVAVRQVVAHDEGRFEGLLERDGALVRLRGDHCDADVARRETVHEAVRHGTVAEKGDAFAVDAGTGRRAAATGAALADIAEIALEREKYLRLAELRDGHRIAAPGAHDADAAREEGAHKGVGCAGGVEEGLELREARGDLLLCEDGHAPGREERLDVGEASG